MLRYKYDYSVISDCLDCIHYNFPDAFINLNEELIIDRTSNIYFRLDDIESEKQFYCKMIAWLSRPAHKGTSKKVQDLILKGLNRFFDKNWTKEDMEIIYTKLGNNINPELCNKFIESGYDLSILKD